MKVKKLTGRILFAGLASFLALPVFAYDGFDLSSAYVGAGGGQTKNKDLGNDTNNNAWKAFVGYDFNKFFGLEAGYVDLGSTSQGPVTAKAKGPDVAAVFNFPFTDNVGIFAKGGVHRFEVTQSALGLSSTDRKTDAAYGAGVKFAFTKNIALRGEWERFEMKNNDSDLVSASLVFNFR